MTNIIYLDIETTTWFDQPEIARLPRDLQISAMQFGCMVTWDEKNGYRLYDPSEVYLDVAFQEIKRFDIVAGWNIINFDIPILARATGLSTLNFPEVYDLFAIIKDLTGRWYKLDDMAQANLGKGKTADGLQAAKWLAEGGEENVKKALTYCQNDVALEMELGEKARSGAPIILPSMKRSGQERELTLVLNWEKQSYQLSGKF